MPWAKVLARDPALLLITNLATALGLIALALLRTHKLLAQRHAFADALQEQKERAQITLESIGDGVITTDVDGAITYMNPAAEALTHWHPSRHRAAPGGTVQPAGRRCPSDGFTLIEHIVRPARRWQRAPKPSSAWTAVRCRSPWWGADPQRRQGHGGGAGAA
jgi:PAS domain-containing protein